MKFEKTFKTILEKLLTKKNELDTIAKLFQTAK